MKRLILPVLATASPALAHPGDHTTSGLVHFLTQPDHLALMALAVGAAVVVILKRRSRR
ncbi:MAG: HupE/UreJ family protein [Tabrizicola sp.]|jgi:hydrogenase/urease accessory protein HupE|nr:HupE/UreJ family protein [Tabrizicola sp.]